MRRINWAQKMIIMSRDKIWQHSRRKPILSSMISSDRSMIMVKSVSPTFSKSNKTIRRRHFNSVYLSLSISISKSNKISPLRWSCSSTKLLNASELCPVIEIHSWETTTIVNRADSCKHSYSIKMNYSCRVKSIFKRRSYKRDRKT